jgi:hypothetical protein
MKKIRFYTILFTALFIVFPLQAGERTIPVDFFVMIDKSLSMAEPGKFQNLQEWVQDQLLGQMLIDGDWITIYDFYGKADHLLTLTVSSAEDRQKITRTIADINPDGQYTDIGLALDTIKTALEKHEKNDRLKIMLLLTDLKQEAPWSSRYAGTADTFESPYLAEARQVKHDQWYEITLDMDIQDTVVATTKALYTSIVEQEAAGTPRILPKNLEIDGDIVHTENLTDTTGETTGKTTGKTGTSGEKSNSRMKSNGSSGALPSIPLLVVGSIVILGGCALLVRGAINNRRRKDQERTKESV